MGGIVLRSGNKYATFKYYLQTWRTDIDLRFAITERVRFFVSHYDAGAYQNFTNLKAFHIKFLEDNTVVPGNTFDEAKVKATCDTGELKFREALEYASGRDDDSRVRAIRYLYNVFENNCITYWLLLRAQHKLSDSELEALLYARDQLLRQYKNTVQIGAKARVEKIAIALVNIVLDKLLGIAFH